MITTRTTHRTRMQRTAKRLMGSVFALFLGIALFAQQDPQFTQYMFNMLALNPAYAGSSDRLNIKALTRHQWVGFEGAPTTQTLTAHSPIVNESLCIGGTIMRDAHGPVTQYGFMADVAYRIFMGESKLAFGLKGGLNLFQGKFAELNPLVAGDQVFQQNVNSKLDPQFGFGMMYYSDRYYLGVSTPKLLRSEFFETDSLAFVSEPGQRSHWFLSGGYVFDMGIYHKFKPTFLVKAVQGAPVSFDLSANFLFYEKFWLGAMYRHQDAVGVLAQYNINDDFSIGYSYDYPLSTLHNYSGGSHEIMLGYLLGKPVKGIRSPRYF
ncbi:MAG: type IX secretion system membrane protein PorP/SprF [Flavobacteriales bacterium]|nr:type IX secretion system membrane protein PorP/SprF [Flavobacteriales bacterium]MBP7408727.1 type IX secretion system membrane protein PorP/SprF [Flavobacteriales bacterium]